MPTASDTAVQVAKPITPKEELKRTLLERDPAFFRLLRRATGAASSFEDVVGLSTLRRRAAAMNFADPAAKPKTLRLAVIGGYSFYPLHELAQHFFEVSGNRVELFQGSYDNYVSEILEEDSPLYQFKPEVILLLPAARRCKYPGRIYDPKEQVEQEAARIARDILQLCATVHQRAGAEVVLTNLALPANFDPGPYRTRSMASDWSFTKLVNLSLGRNAPSGVHICDVEFLSARRGAAASTDARGWFESKQPWAPDLQMDVAREVTHIVSSLRRGPKKVAVLDLDNTLWGGVIGDDGLEGIEIGDTSPRGEAFKAFQQYLLSLTERGILLAVSSKNDHEKAIEPFEKHPEMVLRMRNFAAFRANWEPKSENIRQIAADLNLGIDSLVFIDDNPAEIEIVNQFVPEVETVWVGADPSTFIEKVQSARLFEPLTVTAEDAERAEQYQQEARRQQLLTSSTDMKSYLRSLEMKGVIREFRAVDAPRISQLINKSNQFNLTTRRRTEAEVLELIGRGDVAAFTARLADRFGDHGLIAVVIGRKVEEVFAIDTWLMSCRVLKRQVEEETVNEIARLAMRMGAKRVAGVYLPTSKNGMVRDLYPRMGFAAVSEAPERLEFELDLSQYEFKPTEIDIVERAYDPN